MKRISIQQPIINAIDETDPSLARFQNQMMKWSKYLEKKIDSKLGYTYKALKYTVDGCSIDLPDDCIRPYKVLVGDYEDVCNARYLDEDWTGINLRTDTRLGDEWKLDWLWQPVEASFVQPLLWEEVLDELHFLNDMDSIDVTLLYQAIETNPNGYWIINESHSDAIMKFIMFKFSKKYLWKINKSDKMLRSGHIQFVKELERDYNIAVRNARAEDGRASPFEKAQY